MEFREVIEVDDINYRTNDVKTQGSFESLMISPSTVTNLRNHGYRIPSPVQMKAIPTGLTGFDMLVQAKSGTGKTLVFSVLAVENLNLQSNDVQRMVVAPTREIAIQIKDTIKKIAHFKTRVILLVGGTPVHLDVQALKRGGHIVVGTTGRICQMAQNGNLDMNCIDLFVLDEADKLMEECFQKDINYLFSALPPTRQVVVFSATYPKNLDLLLMKFMRDPSLVRLNSDDVQLVGIKQYVITTDEASLDILVRLLKSVHFNQTLVFCNLHQQCERTTVHLESVGFNSAYISAQLTQPQRDAVVEKLKQNKIKVLVSTDLTARGIDAASVNLVVNLGSAINVETYLHRIGRAARFGMLWKYSSGGYGAAVTILSDSREISRFKAIAREGGINVRNLDLEVLPPDLTVNQSFFDLCSHFGTIQENCAKSKYSTHKSVQECSVSKITNEDININQKSLDRNPASACYDRQTLLSISRYPIILSEKMQKQICDIGIVRCENPNISSLDKKGHVLEMRSGETIPESPSTDCIREPIKKSTTTDLKFIPFCEKTRRLFYMRGDLIRILESIDKESWKQYASSKFDMSCEPFLCNNDMNGKQSECGDAPGSDQRTTFELDNKVLHNEKKHIRYSKKDLIAILNSVSKKAWLSYVKSRWDTSREPFQLNEYMRCSFELQLRRQRLLEKNKRTEILKSRQKAQQQKQKLMASSRTYTNGVVSETSFESFCQQVNKEFVEYFEKRNTTSGNLGPVVPIRDTPDEWASKVDYYTTWLRNFDISFQYDVYKEAGRICEATTGMDPGECCSISHKFESVSTQTCALIDNDFDKSSSNSMVQNIVTNFGQISEDGQEVPTGNSKQITSNQQFLKQHYRNKEYILMNVVLETFANEKSNGKSKFYPSDSEERQLKAFIDNYRKNVDLQVAFSSYMSMLHSIYH